MAQAVLQGGGAQWLNWLQRQQQRIADERNHQIDDLREQLRASEQHASQLVQQHASDKAELLERKQVRLPCCCTFVALEMPRQGVVCISLSREEGIVWR